MFENKKILNNFRLKLIMSMGQDRRRNGKEISALLLTHTYKHTRLGEVIYDLLLLKNCLAAWCNNCNK